MACCSTSTTCDITYTPSGTYTVSTYNQMKANLIAKAKQIQGLYSIGEVECARKEQRKFLLASIVADVYCQYDCNSCSLIDATEAKNMVDKFNYYIKLTTSVVTTVAAAATTGDTKIYEDGVTFIFEDGDTYIFE